MIHIKELEKRDVGHWVTYKSPHGMETGRIKSWNSAFIFVVFNCGGDWEHFKSYPGIAINPKGLVAL